jgi:hypothetical protein
MPVTFVAGGAEGIDKPSGLTDGSDLMLALVVCRQSATILMPTGGWQKAGQAEASDPASWGVTTSPVRLIHGTILGYSGADLIDPIYDISANGGVGVTPRWLSADTVDEGVAVGIGSSTGVPMSQPGSTTHRYTPGGVTTGDPNGVGWEVTTTGAATGDLDGGLSSSSGWSAFVASIRPVQPRWVVGRGHFGTRRPWT